MQTSRRARMRLGRRLSWLVVASLTAAALFAPSAAVRAASVAPVYLAGASNTGKDCVDLDQDYGQTWLQAKQAPNGNAAIVVAGVGTITVSNTTGDKTFDWSSDFGIDAVIVKGGSDGSYAYIYATSAAATESLGDTGLTTPGTNGISHISFCYDTSDPQPTPTPTATPEPTPTATPEPTPTATPEPTPTATPEPTPTATPEPTPTATPELTPTATPTATPEPTEELPTGDLVIVKVDDNGTPDVVTDDEFLDGASFTVSLDDGDGTYEVDEDPLVDGPFEAEDGIAMLTDLEAGWYWIVEVVVPDGYVGSGPILVELTTETDTTCEWDRNGLIGCVDGDPEDGPFPGETWVWVDNTPQVEPTPEPTATPTPEPTATPTGGVGGATGTPGITLPPTDALGAGTAAPTGDSWRLILLGMAGLLAISLLLTPTRSVVRRED